MKVSAEQECAWVLRAQQGDQTCFANLVETYQRPIFNLAYRMLGSRDEAEDAAQEAFLRAYTKLDSYNPELKFSSWILSIASHHCVDRLRRRRGNTVSMDEINSWRWVPDQRLKPEERTLEDERAAAIREQLERLPDQYRLVVVLRYWHDMSYVEIAEITDTTESAVKSRLHRARRMMAENMNQAEAVSPAPPSDRRRVSKHAMSEGF